MRKCRQLKGFKTIQPTIMKLLHSVHIDGFPSTFYRQRGTGIRGLMRGMATLLQVTRSY